MASRRNPPQEHDRYQVANVEAISRWIKACIDAATWCCQPFAEGRGIRALVDEAARGEVSNKVVRHGGMEEGLSPHVVVGEGMSGIRKARLGEGLEDLFSQF